MLFDLSFFLSRAVKSVPELDVFQDGLALPELGRPIFDLQPFKVNLQLSEAVGLWCKTLVWRMNKVQDRLECETGGHRHHTLSRSEAVVVDVFLSSVSVLFSLSSYVPAPVNFHSRQKPLSSRSPVTICNG